MQQKSSSKFWVDEKGVSIPYSRVDKLERLMESKSGSILKKSLAMNDKLRELKDDISEVCHEVYERFMAERGVDPKNRKGNFTWYNFDRSIKIEVSINERIAFDELGIVACKAKLDEFLSAQIESKSEFIKDMVLDAFETSKGKLDAKKVMSLIRYKSKINKPLFTEAIELLEEAIRRPDSRTYFRVWHKNDDGEYKNVDLNFSSI